MTITLTVNKSSQRSKATVGKSQSNTKNMNHDRIKLDKVMPELIRIGGELSSYQPIVLDLNNGATPVILSKTITKLTDAKSNVQSKSNLSTDSLGDLSGGNYLCMILIELAKILTQQFESMDKLALAYANANQNQFETLAANIKMLQYIAEQSQDKANEAATKKLGEAITALALSAGGFVVGAMQYKSSVTDYTINRKFQSSTSPLNMQLEKWNEKLPNNWNKAGITKLLDNFPFSDNLKLKFNEIDGTLENLDKELKNLTYSERFDPVKVNKTLNEGLDRLEDHDLFRSKGNKKDSFTKYTFLELNTTEPNGYNQDFTLRLSKILGHGGNEEVKDIKINLKNDLVIYKEENNTHYLLKYTKAENGVINKERFTIEGDFADFEAYYQQNSKYNVYAHLDILKDLDHNDIMELPESVQGDYKNLCVNMVKAQQLQRLMTIMSLTKESDGLRPGGALRNSMDKHSHQVNATIALQQIIAMLMGQQLIQVSSGMYEMSIGKDQAMSQYQSGLLNVAGNLVNALIQENQDTTGNLFASITKLLDTILQFMQAQAQIKSEFSRGIHG
jgi:hypothetical protein